MEYRKDPYHLRYAAAVALAQIEAGLKIGLIDWQVADGVLQDFGSDPLLTDELREQAWSLHAQVQRDLEDARRGSQESAE